jgi:transposase-like protein
MSTTTRKSYSKEFKETAVNLVLEGSKSQRQIAEEIGINVNTLQNWKKAYQHYQEPEKVKNKALVH